MRPTWAEINLDNIAFNLNSVKNFVTKKIKYMAVVKADAYGHGAVQCAKKLESDGIDWLAVALPEEALELRKSGIISPILCLGSFWLGQENLLLENNITPSIFNLEIAKSFNRAAIEKGLIAKIHLKIDTGMGRVGLRFDEASEFADKLKSLQNLSIEGVMTHFAAADNLSENDFTNLQIERFFQVVDMLEEKGFRPQLKDLANSPGTVAHPNALGNMTRLGGVLYGLGKDVLPQEVNLPQLKPAMSLFTKISHLKRVPKGETLGYGRTFRTKRESIIATIPIGYKDGYRRSLSNCGQVIIRERFAPVVGRISMDWTIIDVTDIHNVRLNDKVILIGKSKNLKITAEDLAQKIDTISYEITCGINRRVTKKYVGSE
jgi:alanine racemase